MNFWGSDLFAPANENAGALLGFSASYALGPGEACNHSAGPVKNLLATHVGRSAGVRTSPNLIASWASEMN
eukprot:COSAG02_NODE_520_length_20751_cov_17.817112_17_plen_71_part_00